MKRDYIGYYGWRKMSWLDSLFWNQCNECRQEFKNERGWYKINILSVAQGAHIFLCPKCHDSLKSAKMPDGCTGTTMIAAKPPASGSSVNNESQINSLKEKIYKHEQLMKELHEAIGVSGCHVTTDREIINCAIRIIKRRSGDE